MVLILKTHGRQEAGDKLQSSMIAFKFGIDNVEQWVLDYEAADAGPLYVCFAVLVLVYLVVLYYAPNNVVNKD